ncbi:hypothetical protein GCM10009119_04390 [Algoriphagus jejuensis]|uniref:Uncharacterized protein n=2 Tax=Algoriphagus jejuensis TaxID=419934 RepID=A0ABN1MVS7_9BACT
MIDNHPDQEIAEKNTIAMHSTKIEKTDFAGLHEDIESSSVNQSSKIWNVTDEYVLPGTTSDGLATGFTVKEGIPLLLTASGEVGFYFAGLTDPATPNGRPELGSINGLPLVSLVARVGDGEFQFVGTGPTQLTGSGELVLYVNDSFFGDNSGAWTVEVSYRCFPGYGLGDKNHYHCK